ncbi:MAG: hypothetical protein CM15mP32_4180 [Flavobacteriaceae bacterium]|nr:MAG: hypothetical protein CM15mP32_4180 [Flavobacteriaceae bacterium]
MWGFWPSDASHKYCFGSDANCIHLFCLWGSGQSLVNRPPGSDANGLIDKEELVSVNIPAGVEDGMQLKMSGKGNDAPGNGISGDLIF